MSDHLAPIPWIDVVLIFALISLNGVLAMSELAIVSAREARLKALAKGGSILISSDCTTNAASAGIYWLCDRNGDGSCSGPDEIALFSPTAANNDREGACVQAPR